MKNAKRSIAFFCVLVQNYHAHAESITVPMTKGLTIQISNNSVQTIHASESQGLARSGLLPVQTLYQNPLRIMLMSTAGLYLSAAGLLMVLARIANHCATVSAWKTEAPLDVLKQVSTQDLIKELVLDLSKQYKEQEAWKILYCALQEIEIGLNIYTLSQKIYWPIDYCKLNFLFSFVYNHELIKAKIQRLEFLKVRITEFLTHTYHASLL